MNRNHALDVARFVSVVAVVLIHVTGAIHNNHIDTFLNYRAYREFLNFAVPFFFAASGFIIYRKSADHEYDNSYLWNYSQRILSYYVISVSLFVAFALVTAATNRLFLHQSLRSAVSKVLHSLNYANLFNGNIGSYHLWFLASLFGSCVLLMVFRRMRLDARAVVLAGSVLYLLSLIGYVTIDTHYEAGGLTNGLFYLTIGYFAASLDPARVRRPLLGLLISATAFYVCGLTIRSISAVPLAAMTFYLLVLCAKHPSFGKDSYFSRVGSRSLEIYVFHIAALTIIERVYVYSGIVEWYRYPQYYVIAALFSFFFSLVIYRAVAPLYNRIKTGRGFLLAPE